MKYFLFLCAMFVAMDARADQVGLAWDASVDPMVTGYYMLVGPSTRSYNQKIDVGNVLAYSVQNLTAGQTYYFTVTSYNAARAESGYSNEVFTTVAAGPPPPADIMLGESAVLGSPDSGNGNWLLAQSAVLAQFGSLQSLSIYASTAGGNVALGVYDATGPAGGPGTKKAETASFVPVVGWNTIPVLSPTFLPPGTYWLAFAADSDTLAVPKGVTAGITSAYYTRVFGPLPATFSTTPTADSVHWSLYATLKPVPVAPTNPRIGP